MENEKVISFLLTAERQFNKHRTYFGAYYWNKGRNIPKVLEEESRLDREAFERVRKILEMQNTNWNVG